MQNKFCFSINSFQQAKQVILICKSKKILPIIHIKYYIVIGLGINWIKELKNLLEKELHKKNFELFIDCKSNHALLLNLIDQKIKYLKIITTNKTLEKFNHIIKKNKVLLNPNFSIMDLSRIKKLELKIDQLIS